jgi:hypothetical protein
MSKKKTTVKDDPKKPRKKKPDGLTKVIRVELSGCDGDFAEEKRRLVMLSCQMQQITNDFYSQWFRLHRQAGSPTALRKWIEEDKEWARKYAKLAAAQKAEKNGKKGKNGKKKASDQPKVDIPPRIKCPVQPYTNEMGIQIYGLLTTQHANLGTKPIGIVTNRLSKTLIKAPATKSKYKRWFRILTGLGEYPQSSKPLPVPFYTSNSNLVVPRSNDEPWKLTVRYEKIEGKRFLRPMTFRLTTGGRKLSPIRRVLWKIASGDYILNTSQLVQFEGKWYADICYLIPGVTASFSSTKTAIVSAGRYGAVLFRINGKTQMRMRSCKHIKRARRSLTLQRFGKNESYKYASSARKNHGRKVHDWRKKSERNWRNRTKTFNNNWAAEVISTCVKFGIGRLVTYQPTGKWRDSRYLSHVGKIGRSESTAWDWYHMQRQLEQVGKAAGINVVIKQGGKSRKKEDDEPGLQIKSENRDS